MGSANMESVSFGFVCRHVDIEMSPSCKVCVIAGTVCLMSCTSCKQSFDDKFHETFPGQTRHYSVKWTLKWNQCCSGKPLDQTHPCT